MPTDDNESKAVYGLFQIAFAGLDTQLTQTLVLLMRPGEPNLARSIVQTLSFRTKLTVLRRAMRAFEETARLENDMADLKATLKSCEAISEWRNERIHAHVRFTDSEMQLLDREGRLLDLDPPESKRQIARIAVAMVQLHKHARTMLTHLEFVSKLEELFSNYDPEMPTE
jgi:hypothetical protein